MTIALKKNIRKDNSMIISLGTYMEKPKQIIGKPNSAVYKNGKTSLQYWVYSRNTQLV